MSGYGVYQDLGDYFRFADDSLVTANFGDTGVFSQIEPR